IFRAYDIRGIVGDNLSDQDSYLIGQAIGTEALIQGEEQVIVGYDGRLSSPLLTKQLMQGLISTGCDVIDIGMQPTPVVYYAAHTLKTQTAVIVTGSHNPINYNGFKIMIAGDTLALEQIQALKQRIEQTNFLAGQGVITQQNIVSQYLNFIEKDIRLQKKLHVVIDCGNGVTGNIAPLLFKNLGCQVVTLYGEINGHFPNHHPDPSNPKNLIDLIARVKSEKADIGLAFDGDGDRVGIVTNQGHIIYSDKALMLFAKDVLSRNPQAQIIFDVKCSNRLTHLIKQHDGKPLMWKTGHSLIKKKMKETNALLAGEMSGHFFFKERWFGFDDGLYSAARLLEIVSQDNKTTEQLFSLFNDTISTPEITVPVVEHRKFEIIEALKNRTHWGAGKITTLDGFRIDYPKSWGLIRASNTTPMLVLRFEADDATTLIATKNIFRQQLAAVAPEITLSF
ncbi:UNVERIFIED_CONTAM: hypothetical protein GTU68_060392, partial [Idotea baltica]|nr:hypothetical protein [Idotea baltica]